MLHKICNYHDDDGLRLTSNTAVGFSSSQSVAYSVNRFLDVIVSVKGCLQAMK